MNLHDLFGFPGTVGALLLAGHALGEFVTGPGEGRFPGPGGWIRHGAALFGWHFLLLLPLLPGGALSLLLAAAIAAVGHVAVELLVGWIRGRTGKSRTLELFLLDQAGHGAVLLLAAVLLLRQVDPHPLLLRAGLLPDLTSAAVAIAGIAFNVGGGAAVVHGVLARLRFPEDLEPPGGSSGDPVPGSGRAIGILERLILFPLVVLGEWSGIGLILAGKSLARFRELDSRPFAEYYLIGTLTSLIVAMVTGLLVRTALGI